MAGGNRAQTPKRAQFIANLIANGGNLSKAAADAGYNPQHGRRLAAHPDVQAALAAAKNTVENQLTQWADLQQEARDKLADLMRNGKDERVQFLATKEIIERHEGKTATKVEHSGEVSTRAVEDEGTVMAIMTLMGRRGWTFTQAYSYVKANPREVGEWLKQLPAGQPPETIPEADYEVVDEGSDS